MVLRSMMRTLVRATVVLVMAAGCKKPPEGGAPGSSGSGSATREPRPAVVADAPAAPPVTDAAPAPATEGPFAIPAGARVVLEREARKADASSIGADVTLHVVDRVATDDAGDSSRHVDQVVVLTGAGAMAVEVGYVRDQDPEYRDKLVRPHAPLDPPRAFQRADAAAPLKFKGPLLYLKHWKAGDLAVAHDGDAIVVWRSETLQGEGEDGQAQDWYEQARIKLAAGAKVTAK
jgi:hypothetical protein